MKDEVSSLFKPYIQMIVPETDLYLPSSSFGQCGGGHESAGEVIQVGEGVTNLKVGE